MIRSSASQLFKILSAVILSLCTYSIHASDQPSPTSNFILNGKPVAPWALYVGNEKNWSVAINGVEGKTVGGNLTVQPSKDKEKAAIEVFWKGRKGPASLSLGGPDINLENVVDDVALVFDIKLDKKVTRPIDLSVDCTYPCRGTIPIRKILEAYPTKEWITIPFPLKWFADAGADLSKMNGPFHLQTEGKVKMHIANVRLLLLPK